MRTFSADRFERAGKPVRPGSKEFIQEKDLIHGGVEGDSVDQGFRSLLQTGIQRFPILPVRPE
jgi:hypothetical protein